MATPSRRSLEALSNQLQLAEPKDWPDHLQHAFAIVAKRKSAEEAKAIVIETVKSAHHCAMAVSQTLLSHSRGDSLERFIGGRKEGVQNSCVRIANCLKRLRKETRDALDDVARQAFAGNDVNSESILDFFLKFCEITKKSPQDKNTAEILKYLGLAPVPPFFEIEDEHSGTVVPLTTCYESLSPKLQIQLESNLRELASNRQGQLTAHDVFRVLADVGSAQDRSEVTIDVKVLLTAYVQEIAEMWKKATLKVGRSTNEQDPMNLGPFPNFVERVLLSQFDANHDFFNRPDEEKVWDAYESLPEGFRDAADECPQPPDRLITDRLLRQALKALSKKVG